MKTLTILLMILVSSAVRSQTSDDPFGCHGLSFKECREHGKEVRQWCKENGVKGHFGDPLACQRAYDADQSAKSNRAANNEQVKIDQVAMESYAQFGKPTGLSFTEWEKVEVNAWKADTQTTLSFADWLTPHLTK
jgi:hypothetical protein